MILTPNSKKAKQNLNKKNMDTSGIRNLPQRKTNLRYVHQSERIACSKQPYPTEAFYANDRTAREKAWEICSRKQDEAIQREKGKKS